MKYRMRYALPSLLISSVLMLVPLAALAVAPTSSSSLSASPPSSKAVTSNDDTTKIEISKDKLADRIALFKTKFKISLTTAEITDLKLHCAVAQVNVGKLDVRFIGNVAIRTKAYSSVQARLTKLITELKAKGVDTTSLIQEQTVLTTKIATYNSDLTAYKQALVDLKGLDCKTDPSSFKAALEAARSAHDTLASDALAVRTYLVDTIKPTLQTLEKTLETNP